MTACSVCVVALQLRSTECRLGISQRALRAHLVSTDFSFDLFSAATSLACVPIWSCCCSSLDKRDIYVNPGYVVP